MKYCIPPITDRNSKLKLLFFHCTTNYQDKPLQYFDYEAYKKELLKFKLPSQEFSFVIQEYVLVQALPLYSF